MADNFEQVEGGIRVKEKDGRFQRVQTPQGFTDHAFRNAVAAFDTAYRTLGKLPSITEVHRFWPNIPVKTYSALFLTNEFKEALAYRGVSWSDDTGLSMEQSMALLALTDPTDRRTTAVKMRDLGIPMARYQAWLGHPLFMESYRARQEANLKQAIPMVLGKLVGNAEAGDMRAIEKVLEITGRWNPAQQQLEDAKGVIAAVMELVVMHVKDPEERRAILSGVEAQVVGFALTHRPPELER